MAKNISYIPDNISKVYEEYVVDSEYKTSENEYYTCKYCGENDIKKFKSKAHILPEFTGNKNSFCYDECDACNNKFSVYEYNLKNFGAFKNTHLPIFGKKKFPKYIDGENNFTLKFSNENTLVMSILNNSEFYKIENNRLKITSTTMPFVPLLLYKCIVKFAFSMMQKKDFIKFEKALPWINEIKLQKDDEIPFLLFYNPNGKPIIEPLGLLLKRKIEYNCPEFSFIFFWGFLKFQIFLPFNSTDKSLDYSNLKLPILPDFVTINKENKFGLSYFDMDSLDKIKSIEKLNFGIKNTTEKDI